MSPASQNIRILGGVRNVRVMGDGWQPPAVAQAQQVDPAQANRDAIDRRVAEGVEAVKRQLQADLDKHLQAETATLRQAHAALAAAAEQLNAAQSSLAKQAEGELLELAMAIAKQVLAQEIQAQSYDIGPIVQRALAQVPTRRGAEIRLNPADLHRAKQAGADLPEGGSAGDLRFVADADVPPAGCIVETDEGVVESTVEAQMETAAEVLQQERAASQRELDADASGPAPNTTGPANPANNSAEGQPSPAGEDLDDTQADPEGSA